MTAADASPHRSPARPSRVAAIDVGSNAIRFIAAEFSGPGRWRKIESDRAAVRLGSSAFRTGELDPARMEEAVEALGRFRDRLDALEIGHHRAVGTSALRESRNGPELVRRVGAETGIELEPISGAEEARLVWTAVRRHLPEGERDWIIADLGGGSLEVSRVTPGGIAWSESHPLGTLRLLDALGPKASDVRRVREWIERQAGIHRIATALAPSGADEVIMTGGNIEALREVAEEEGLTPAARGHGAMGVLSVSALHAVIARMDGLSAALIADRWSLRPDRADVILPAAIAYATVAELAGAERILVPDAGVKEGILLDLHAGGSG